MNDVVGLLEEARLAVLNGDYSKCKALLYLVNLALKDIDENKSRQGGPIHPPGVEEVQTQSV